MFDVNGNCNYLRAENMELSRAMDYCSIESDVLELFTDLYC